MQNLHSEAKLIKQSLPLDFDCTKVRKKIWDGINFDVEKEKEKILC
jgi:hypothetical protein